VGTLLGFVALDPHTIVGSTDAGNMARSTDGGHCWAAGAVDSGVPHRLGEFLRDPRHRSVILAGAGNPARVGFPVSSGLLRSTDAGKSWQTLGSASGLPSTLFSVVALTATASALFAAIHCGDEVALLQQRRRVAVQCSRPIYRSLDGGRTWRPTGLGSGPIGAFAAPLDSSVQALAAGPEGTLYAAVLPLQGDAGLYRSTDGGVRWRLMSREDRLRGTTALLAPGPASVVLAGVGLSTLNGQILRSPDGGRTWQVALAAAGMRDPLVLGFVSLTHSILCAGLKHLYDSIDGGQHWSQIQTIGLPVPGSTSEGQREPTNSYLGRLPINSLLLAMVGGLFRSDDDGMHWRRL
jgi:photosystem II stability/assembly factor-like uncharacterized protein